MNYAILIAMCTGWISFLPRPDVFLEICIITICITTISTVPRLVALRLLITDFTSHHPHHLMGVLKPVVPVDRWASMHLKKDAHSALRTLRLGCCEKCTAFLASSY